LLFSSRTICGGERLIKPVSIPINKKFREDCAYYAHIIVEDSFQNGMKSRFGSGGFFKHYVGKMGEMAFFKFCMQEGIAVKHIPFREGYADLNERDDFVVIIHNVERIIEVKTAVLKDLKLDKELRLFYNEKQYNDKGFPLLRSRSIPSGRTSCLLLMLFR